MDGAIWNEVPASLRLRVPLNLESTGGSESCEVEGHRMNEASAMRRLLFLVPFPPRLDARHGGARVLAQLLEALARRHKVALLCLRAAEEPGVDDQLRGRCALVEEFVRWGRKGPLRPRAQQRAKDALLRLRGMPEPVVQCAMTSLHERSGALARSWRPDLVQFEYHVMGQYVSALNQCSAPRVLNQHEPALLAVP